jgi:hypothetical protein
MAKRLDDETGGQARTGSWRTGGGRTAIPRWRRPSSRPSSRPSPTGPRSWPSPWPDPARLPAAARPGPRRRRQPGPLDCALAGLALVSLLYPLLVLDDFARRVVRPPGWTWSCWCWRRAGVPSAGSCRPDGWLRRLSRGCSASPRTWPPPASCCSPCRRPPWARPPTGGSRLTRGACGAVDNPVHPLPGSATLPLGAPPTGRWG